MQAGHPDDGPRIAHFGSARNQKPIHTPALSLRFTPQAVWPTGSKPASGQLKWLTLEVLERRFLVVVQELQDIVGRFFLERLALFHGFGVEAARTSARPALKQIAHVLLKIRVDPLDFLF